MARHDVTETTFSCDLCGTVFNDRKTLVELRDCQRASSYGHPYHRPADICTDCQRRPISDLVAFFSES